MELGQRQTPEGFVFRLSARQQAIRQRIVKAEQRVVIIAQRGFRRAGQGGGVDDQLWLLRRGVNQAIRQHQAAFRVSVHNFNGFAVAIMNNIAQFEGVTADQVVGAAQEQLHAFVQTAGNGESQRAGDSRRTAHIGFHRIHKGALLDAVAAGIKGDAFAHQAGVYRRLFIAGRVIVQRQQDRRTLGAAAHGMQTKIALLAQIFAFGDAIANLLTRHAAQQVDSALRQLLRTQLFRRRIDGVAHPVDDRQAVIQLAALRVVKGWPFDLTLTFRPFIAGPKGPGAIGVPAFAAQGDVLDAHAVNFARRALDKPEVVFTVEM